MRMGKAKRGGSLAGSPHISVVQAVCCGLFSNVWRSISLYRLNTKMNNNERPLLTHASSRDEVARTTDGMEGVPHPLQPRAGVLVAAQLENVLNKSLYS